MVPIIGCMIFAMCGLLGILKLDGSNVQLSDVEMMKHSLQHLAVDGMNMYVKGGAGMVSMYLHISPESVYERQPLENIQGKIIVADARIDNRVQLLDELQIPEETRAFLPDSELILAAYEKWGEGCADRLIGDFVFVIWDIHQNQLFCARDHIGARPLYYYHLPGKVFAFASEIKGLLALDFVPQDLDEFKIAAHLSKLSDFRSYVDGTYFQSIKSVKPAHFLTVSAGQFSQKFYWDLRLERFSHLKTDEDFIQEFRKTFIESVRCRTRTAFPIAAHLSGGLDSSSVSCVARDILRAEGKELHTFHMDVELPECDEKPYAEAVLAEGGFRHHYVKISDFDFYRTTTEVAYMIDAPSAFVVTPPAQAGWMKGVQKEGCRVLLTGHEGDIVVDYGMDVLWEPLKKGQWEIFEKNFDDYAQYAVNFNFSKRIKAWSPQKIKTFYRGILLETQLKDSINQRKWGKVKGILTRRSHWKSLWEAGKFRVEVCWPAITALGRLKANPNYTILGPALQKYTPAHPEMSRLMKGAENNAGIPEKLVQHFQQIFSEGMTKFCDIFAHVGAHHGFKVAHPFLDRRLIELSLLLPTTLNFNEGKRRGTIREAMKGIMPESVRLRAVKVNFEALIHQTLLKATPSFEEYYKNAVAQFPILRTWINEKEFLKRIEVCTSNDYPEEFKSKLIWHLFRSIYLINFYSTYNKYPYEKEVSRTETESSW